MRCHTCAYGTLLRFLCYESNYALICTNCDEKFFSLSPIVNDDWDHICDQFRYEQDLARQARRKFDAALRKLTRRER